MQICMQCSSNFPDQDKQPHTKKKKQNVLAEIKTTFDLDWQQSSVLCFTLVSIASCLVVVCYGC